MTNNVKHEDPKLSLDNLNHNESTQAISTTKDLSKNPDYQKLLALFQKAEFSKCRKLLDHLQERYPNHPLLADFRDELDMKLSVKDLSAKIKKAETHERRKATFNLGLFAMIGTIVVLFSFLISLFYFGSQNFVQHEAQTPTQTPILQVSQLYNQADNLLRVGQPSNVVEIIERIKTLDPDNQDLNDLITRTEVLLALEAQYHSALKLISENNHSEALEILLDIEKQSPGLWDVKQNITALEKNLRVKQLLIDAESAYQSQNWALVINDYESALEIDPTVSSLQINKKLLEAYLNQIILITETEGATIQEIELAEKYYRRAAAIIPQSPNFAEEREALQEVRRNLLEVKYSLIANNHLAASTQTAHTIELAISNLRRAAAISQENNGMQANLDNAAQYQAAFYHFINLHWTNAIEILQPMVNTDPGYAGGNAAALLYESYYALSREHHTVGNYQDAVVLLEQANALVWEGHNNLAKRFQTQVLLGDTFAKLEEFEQAVTHYKSALRVIQSNIDLDRFSNITDSLAAADSLSSAGNFENAMIAYQEILKDPLYFFSLKEIEILKDNCLALIAHHHSSTLDLMHQANHLTGTMVLTEDRTMLAPMLTE